MSTVAARTERPASVAEAAELLRELGGAGQPLRVVGGDTKRSWAGREPPVAVELHTGALAGVVEHNAGDFTAVLEAGVPLAEAQARFARAGQMLALDPPLAAAGGGEPRATIGGVLASGDSGPLRHRYGGPRDLVLGVTVALSDGTVARAGGRVIKNVAGYDLGKLFAGSRGTLGLVATVAVRLHPLAPRQASARAHSHDPAGLARAAAGLAALPLEAECLDVRWEGDAGAVLVRVAGPTAVQRAQSAAERMSALGLGDSGVVLDDEPLWEAQRAAQRAGAGGAVVRVAGVIGDLERVLGAARAAGADTVVTRAALGLSWVHLPAGEQLNGRVQGLRTALAGLSVTVLDGAAQVEDPWPLPAPAALAVMERIKARFDPARVFAPGAFVGGI